MGVLRRDMIGVTVDLLPDSWWSYCRGGAVRYEGYEVSIDPLVLGRLRRHDDDASPEILCQNVGKPLTVQLEHLDASGERTGYGLSYTGKLTAAKLTEADANRDDVAIDEIVVDIQGVTRLSQERELASTGRN